MDGLDKKIIGKVFTKMFYGREAPEPSALHRADMLIYFLSSETVVDQF